MKTLFMVLPGVHESLLEMNFVQDAGLAVNFATNRYTLEANGNKKKYNLRYESEHRGIVSSSDGWEGNGRSARALSCHRLTGNCWLLCLKPTRIFSSQDEIPLLLQFIEWMLAIRSPFLHQLKSKGIG